MSIALAYTYLWQQLGAVRGCDDDNHQTVTTSEYRKLDESKIVESLTALRDRNVTDMMIDPCFDSKSNLSLKAIFLKYRGIGLLIRRQAEKFFRDNPV